MPSKQQQLYPAVWVKERGLILLPPRGRSQTCLCTPAGSCSLFTSCMFQHMLLQRSRGRSLGCTRLVPDSELSSWGEAGLSPGSASSASH